MSRTTGRYLNSIINGPPAVNATKGGCALDNVSCNLNCGLQRQVLIPVSVPSVLAVVTQLLGVSGPSAISRLIIAVVVNPINRVFGGWSRPHVGIERHEVGLPSLANAYAATAPQREATVSAIGASSNHPKPHTVFRSSGPAVNGKKTPCCIDRKATAGLTHAISQIGTIHSALGAAVTNTVPHTKGFVIRSAANHRPPTEALSAEVFHFCHAYLAGSNAKQIAIAGDYRE